MKKTLLIILTLCLFLSPLAAQSLSVGSKAVVGHSSFRGLDWFEDNMFSLTYSAGGFFIFQMTPSSGIQVDVLYSRLSGKYGDESSWASYTWNALSFPVYARFNQDFGGLQSYFLLGLDFSLLFGEYHWKNSAGATASNDVDTLFENVFSMGFAAGAGITIPMGNYFVDAGLRYRTSFNDRFLAYEIFDQSITLDLAYGVRLF